MVVSRRIILAAGAVCVGVGAVPSTAFALDGDMTVGDPAAPVQLVEYASMTCPHCAAFHAEAFPRLKAEYIDAGRIGFTLREYLTAPGPVSAAMFQVARCGGVDAATYFERVGVLFREQRAILSTGTGAGVRDALFALGATWGLSQDQVMAAITDQAGYARIEATMDDGRRRFALAGTPSFVLNDQVLPREPAGVTYAGIAAALNTALGA